MRRAPISTQYVRKCGFIAVSYGEDAPVRFKDTCARLLLGTLLVLGLSLPHVALAVSMMPDDEAVSTEGGMGYLPSNEPVLSTHEEGEGTDEQPPLREAAPPSSYSSVDGGLVTPVKDQGSFNTCWAFSSLGAIEASSLLNGTLPGETAATLDLSERHLTFFTYNTQPDPLGGTRGDSTAPHNSTYVARGGNDLIATYTLATWMGVVPEGAVGSYDDLLDNFDASNPTPTNLDPSLSHSLDVLHLARSLRIPMKDAEDVKRAIMSYGGVSVGLYMSNANLNRTTGAYLCKTSTSANHAVLVVGWDDNYAVSNFKEGAQPSAPGAWLVRNSWGTTWGNEGFFWISYEDVVVGKQNATAYAVEPADARDNIYQHDGSASMFYNYVRTGGSIANVFTARGNQGGTEELSAVGFALTSTNVDYAIQVYTDIAWLDDPTSGTAQLAEPQTGTGTYAGYQVVDLDQAVELEQGQTFSVVVTLTLANPGEGLGDDGNLVGYDVDRTNLTSLYYRFTNEVEPGQSYERDYDGANWNDLSDAETGSPNESYDRGDEVVCSARLKAFTVNVGGTGEPDPNFEPTNPPQVRPTPGPDPGPDPDPEVETVPVYRMYNTRTSEHLYTRIKREYDACGEGSYADWRAEGIAWYAPAAGTEGARPVWRLYNLVSGDHHYTTSETERAQLLDSGDWRDEGVAFWSGGEVPVYRLYNGRLKRGQHHYTTRSGERSVLVESRGWSDEGVGLYCVRK